MTRGIDDRDDRSRQRRRIARAHHPDLGGDPRRYVQLMRELDLRFVDGAPGIRPARIEIVPGRSPGARLRRALRRPARTVRAARTRLPRRLPGTRRYVEL